MFNGTSCSSRQSYRDMRIEAPPGSSIGGVKIEHTLLSIQGYDIGGYSHCIKVFEVGSTGSHEFNCFNVSHNTG